jgi:hypothetical protein
MYRVIGVDGREYGPVTLEQLHQWKTEGRINSQALVREDMGRAWKPLADWPVSPQSAVPPITESVTDDANSGWLVRHFRRHERRTPGQFLWRVSLEGFVVAAIIGVIVTSLGIEGRDLKPSEFPILVISAIVIAPLLETLLLQLLPIAATRACGASRWTQMIVSIILFAFPHFLVSPGVGLAAGLVGGFYFAFAFTHWQRRSLSRAYWMTVAQHAIHNTFATVLLGLGLLAS